MRFIESIASDLSTGLHQNKKLHNRAINGYAVRGTTTIAQELIEECQTTGRVAHPLYVESDSPKDCHSLYDVRETMLAFIDEIFGLNPGQCAFFVSGSSSGPPDTIAIEGGSLHAHLPLYVTDADVLDSLRAKAIEFNEGQSISIDYNIYTRNRQFRIPLTRHRNGGTKTPVPSISPSDEPILTKNEMIEAGEEEPPETYREYASSFPMYEWGPERTEEDERVYTDIQSYEIAQYSNNTASDCGAQTPAIEAEARTVSLDERAAERGFVLNSLLKENDREFVEMILDPERPEQEPARQHWNQYNGVAFSPCRRSNNEGAAESLVLFVPDELFTHRGDTFAAGFIIKAIGCDGKFDVKLEHRPVLLSGHDVKKVEDKIGQYVVLIGGKSRNSVVLSIPEIIVDILKGTFVESENQIEAREGALSVLEDFKHDTGERGPSIDYPESILGGETEARRLQRLLENGEIRSGHRPLFKVACRLLKIHGYRGTMEWFAKLFGEGFDPEETHRYLETIVAQYPESFDDRIPKKPYNALPDVSVGFD